MYLNKEAIETLNEAIKNSETIIIHRHVRPDPDAIGSQLGLKHLIQSTYPNKKVLVAGTNSKGLAFLGQMDQVVETDYENALVIVTDTANTDRIDGSHYHKGKYLIKIDHHPLVDSYGDLEIIHTQASSCSEIIALIAREFQSQFTMTRTAARLLYAGIVGDTGRFLFDSTSALTHQITSYLYAFDIDAYAINDQFQLKTAQEIKLLGYGYDNIQMYSPQVAYIVVSQSVMKAYGVTEEQTNALVNLPASIEGVKVWVTFVEQEGTSGLVRCRIRSKGPAIHDIAAKFEGGGHPKAAGANIYSLEEKIRLLQALTAAVNGNDNEVG